MPAWNSSQHTLESQLPEVGPHVGLLTAQAPAGFYPQALRAQEGLQRGSGLKEQEQATLKGFHLFSQGNGFKMFALN